MAISSPGVGSGLDVNSIVTQLVAIEKQPLKALQTKATTFQTQLSLYGTIKSQMSALNDAAAAMATDAKWTTQKATSSNMAAATVSAGSTASATSFSLHVAQLARAQSTSSMGVPNVPKLDTNGVPVLDGNGAPAYTGATLGVAGETGTLHIKLGAWTPAAPPVLESFSAGTTVDVVVKGDDSLATIASNINKANAGVTATVVSTGTGASKVEYLTFQSKTTGVDNGFQINTTLTSPTFTGLNKLSLTTLTNGNESSAGMQLANLGLNAKATINGIINIEKPTNTLADAVTGLTLNLLQLTPLGSPVQITVEQDKEVIQKNMQAFADAFSAVSKTLADTTRYVQGGKSGALLGDSTTVGLQSLLRSIVGSSTTVGASTNNRLSDIGLELQKDGSLKLNTAKLTTAMGDPSKLQSLFTIDNGPVATGFNLTNGFGRKMNDFAKGLIAFDGRVTNKTTAIQGSISRNSEEQDRVNNRASRVEVQLRRQYSALDAQMSAMSALSGYVSAQLAQWNKAS